MSQIAIEIGSYSIRAMVRDVINGHAIKRKMSIPSWCAHEEGNGMDDFYIGHKAKLWRYRNLAYPIYFKENPDEYFRNVITAIVQVIKTWTFEQSRNSQIQALHFVTPVYYRSNDPLIDDMKKAASEADINQVYFTQSPEAICKRQAYVNDGESVLIYDLGYRGLSLSLLRRNGSKYEHVVQSEYLEDCAGMKIDSLLINDMVTNAPEDLSSTILLEDAARQIKEGLSIYKTYRCAIPGSGEIYTIDRTRFNDLISSIISRSFIETKKLIEKANEKPAEILICGGTSRIPFIKDRFNYILKEVAPNVSVKDCCLLENSDYLACEGCFMVQDVIEIDFTQ